MKVTENVIEISKLNKSFGDVKAVQDLSFKVKRGELFAFLGVNGAGKSTTINIMCGQLSKDSGQITIDGQDLDKEVDLIKSKLGVVFQNSVLDKALTVRDNLEHRAALYGTYGTSLVRYHSMRGVFAEMEKLDYPEEIIKGFKDTTDCNLYFFDKLVPQSTMFIILAATVVVSVSVYVALNFVKRKRKE